ncbi:MAG: DUF1648 domain-containing protein [Gammaproteobacteria bacterium]|nr:DUF1648 domain-containing protein [Gammaproteobacteria bacterium]
MSAPRRLFYCLVLLAAAQVLYYYPQMPEVVASHFDGRGAPNDWSGRNVFFGIYLSMVAMLVGIFIFVPRRSEKRIGFSLKIPNREYWLAPERLEHTRAFFQRQMIIMGVVHLLLAIFTVQLAILANPDQEVRLHSSIGWALGIYFCFIIAWLVHFRIHFSRT